MAFALIGESPDLFDVTIRGVTTKKIPCVVTIDGGKRIRMQNVVPEGTADIAAFLDTTYPAGNKQRAAWVAKAGAVDYEDELVPKGWKHIAFGEDDIGDKVIIAAFKEVFDELRALGSVRNNASFLAAIKARVNA